MAGYPEAAERTANPEAAAALARAVEDLRSRLRNG